MNYLRITKELTKYLVIAINNVAYSSNLDQIKKYIIFTKKVIMNDL